MATLPTETVLILVFSVVLWAVFRRRSLRDPLRNIDGPPSKSFFSGIFKEMFSADGMRCHQNLSKTYGNVVTVTGMLGKQLLYVSDPKAIYNIIVKDQYVYEETSEFFITNNLVFGPGLLSTMGDHHKKQRKLLNPVFSIAHMREMIPKFYEISQKLEAALNNRAQDGPAEIEVHSWLTRTALELVAQCGLGCSFDTLTEDNERHPYAGATQQLVFSAMKTMIPRTYLLPLFLWIGTPNLRRKFLDLIPWKNAHELCEITDTLDRETIKVYESKKRAMAEGDEAVQRQIASGKDIISILMRANMVAYRKDQLPEKEVIGQMSTLVFAATDTTSNALSRILWLLCTYPDIQQKLRAELRERMDGKNELDFNELEALPYLEAVCREALRLYPPVASLQRITRKDVVMPLSKPIRGKDGKEMHELPLLKDTTIIISIFNCNRNPEIWGPDAEEYKPDRWLKPLPEAVLNAQIPGVYANQMTFSGGGRSCIGFKFSQLEMKVVLSLLVRKFAFSLPKDKNIGWKVAGIATPFVDDNLFLARLPLVVEFAK